MEVKTEVEDVKMEMKEEEAGGAAEEQAHASSELQPRLEQAIEAMYAELQSTLPVGVKTGAVSAIYSDGFSAACRDIAALKEASLEGIAFCVLNAVARLQAASSSSASSLETRDGTGRGRATCRLRRFGGLYRGRMSARAMSRASTRMRGSQGRRRPGSGCFLELYGRGAIMVRVSKWQPRD